MTERVPAGFIPEAGISRIKALEGDDQIRTGVVREAQTIDGSTVPVFSKALKDGEAFNIEVTGRAFEVATGDTQFKKEVGGVNATGGTAAIVGTPTVVDLSEDAGAAAWDITITVATNIVTVNVIGEAAHTIDWTVRVELT